MMADTQIELSELKMLHLKFLRTLCILLLLHTISYAQPDTQKHAGFIEAFGHSRALISVNYERIFHTKKGLPFYTIRAGAGYVPGVDIRSERRAGIVTLPLVFSALYGKKHHFVQLGVGYTAAFGQNFIDSTSAPPIVYQKFESACMLSLGYRYVDIGGLNFQLFPILEWTNNPSERFGVSFGAALGYSW